MKHLAKKLYALLLVVISVLSLTLFSACQDDGEKIQEFYDKVVESQEYLDCVADDIYNNWYDAIYEDMYGGDIDTAILYARLDNKENLALIETNEETIQALYKEVRDSELSSEIKAVMSAYSDYYEFVVNVSGSFKTYSENKETLKKELASALKELSLEM